MKKIYLMVMAGVLVFAAAGCSPVRTAVMSEADTVTAAQVEEMLKNRLYTVNFSRAYPASGPSLPLNYSYHISVIDDRVESFMPYFGRAYTIPYGGGEGLRFAAPISNYNETVKRNGRREITFKARTEEDTYDFYLNIFPLGRCDLTITPGHRQSISFSGDVDLEPEFEAARTE